MTTAEELAALDDRTVQTVEVPEWGMSVSLRRMPIRERDDLVWANRQAIREDRDAGLLKCRMLARCMVSQDRTPVFADPAEGERILQERCATAIDFLWDVCTKQNGLGGEKAEAPQAPNS